MYLCLYLHLLWRVFVFFSQMDGEVHVHQWCSALWEYLYLLATLCHIGDRSPDFHVVARLVSGWGDAVHS